MKNTACSIAWLIGSLVIMAGFWGQSNANPILIPGTWVDITPPGLTALSDPYTMLGQGVTVDPNNPSNIWWCNGTYQPSTKGGLYKSTDGGSTWTMVPPFDVPLHVRINPKNSLQMYLADGVRGNYCGFWKSTDGGATWTQPQGFKTAASDPTVNCFDGYSVAVDPSNFNHVLFSFHGWWAGFTNSSGVLESTDGGETWIIHDPVAGMLAPGFGVFFLYSPDLSVGNSNTWLLGCQGGGYWRTSDAGTTWTQVSTYNMVHGGDQLYYTKSGVLYSGASGSPTSPLRSTDNGVTWRTANSGGMTTLGIMGDGTNLYAGTFNQGGPFMTSPESDGLNWTPYNGSAQRFNSGPFELDFDKANHIMYASTPADGVFALRVNDPNTGIVLTNAVASPASVLDNATTSVTFSVNATGQSSISSVSIDLRPIGGTASVSMTETSGNTYTTAFTVQSGATPGAWSLPLTVTDNNNHTYYSNIAFTVIDHTAPVLVSQNKPVTVSSTQDASTPGSNAVDGLLGTRWASAASDPQWIYVDLGSSMLVEQVIIYWETAYAESYQIQVSNDASTWTSVFSTTTGNGGTDSITFPATSARYVRIYGTQRGTTYGYSLYEFQVYSPPSGATGVKKCLSLVSSVDSPLSLLANGIAVSVASSTNWTLEFFSLNGVRMSGMIGKGPMMIPIVKGELKGSEIAVVRLTTSMGEVANKRIIASVK